MKPAQSKHSTSPTSSRRSPLSGDQHTTSAAETTPDVVVVGSANLDLVIPVDAIPTPGETVLGGDLMRIPGGKGANQAVASARLGRRTLIIGRIGEDDVGAMLRASLESAHVDTAGLRITAGTPSGAALIAVDADGNNAIVVSPGANHHLSATDVEHHAAELAAAPVVLAQLEVPLDAVDAAIRCSRGIVVLNPAPAPTAPLPASMLERVDVLVPNQTELAKLAGHIGRHLHDDAAIDDATTVHAARELRARSVVVTLGAGGALVVTRDDVVHVPAPAVTAVDTTAAGDAFCAALACELAVGATLTAATRHAVVVGTATTLRRGAQPSLPTTREVREWLDTHPAHPPLTTVA